ncbi:MAG: LURP-one-related family protein [Oscillospiraceae bacterium]|nr:LURP-one-related family protein [Oscillospiraceae bacterium]
MQLLIKQRIFTITDHYYVYDETGEIRYEVEDELFRLGHQIHVYDKRTGREVGSIHQRFFTLMPEFEIVIDGRVMGTIRKKISFFTPQYEVDYRGWHVEGNLMGWDYQVMRGDMEVMTISKELFNWSDTYSLRYDNPADEIPGLLLVIAIDAVNCDRNK